MPPWYRAPLVSDLRKLLGAQFAHEIDRFLAGFRLYCYGLFPCIGFSFRAWCRGLLYARWFRLYSFGSRLALRLLVCAVVSSLLFLGHRSGVVSSLLCFAFGAATPWAFGGFAPLLLDIGWYWVIF